MSTVLTCHRPQSPFLPLHCRLSLLILNGLTAKTTVYADFVCSQSLDIWFQNLYTGENLFLKDVNLSGFK